MSRPRAPSSEDHPSGIAGVARLRVGPVAAVYPTNASRPARSVRMRAVSHWSGCPGWHGRPLVGDNRHCELYGADEAFAATMAETPRGQLSLTLREP